MHIFNLDCCFVQVFGLFARVSQQSAPGSEALAASRSNSWQLWRGLQSNSDSTRAAFTFDIDGVLVKGNSVLDQAKRALARLYTQGELATLVRLQLRCRIAKIAKQVFSYTHKHLAMQLGRLSSYLTMCR